MPHDAFLTPLLTVMVLITQHALCTAHATAGITLSMPETQQLRFQTGVCYELQYFCCTSRNNASLVTRKEILKLFNCHSSASKDQISTSLYCIMLQCLVLKITVCEPGVGGTSL